MINASFLSESPLFHNLDELERAQLLIIGQQRSFEANQPIFREGEPGDGLFVVIKGSVRISKQGPSGEEALAVMEQNAFFGEMALIDFAPRAADAIANEATECFFIPLKELRTLIETHHQIALKVLYSLCEVLAQRLRESNERYMSIFTIAQWGGNPQKGIFPLP